jgi:hypothetical protein
VDTSPRRSTPHSGTPRGSGESGVIAWGPGGLIAFDVYEAGDLMGVWIVGSEGGAATNLTADFLDAHSPTFAPACTNL